MKNRLNGYSEDLGAILGVTAAVRLMTLLGGELLYVPTSHRPGHKLEKILGMDAFRSLREEFGGETLRVPTMAFFEDLQMMCAVAHLHREGKSYADIATICGMSRRHVIRLNKSALLLGCALTYRSPYCDEIGMFGMFEKISDMTHSRLSVMEIANKMGTSITFIALIRAHIELFGMPGDISVKAESQHDL